MAKKIPSNFYQEVNVRKLNNVFDSGLPSIGSDDNGKVVKVVENKFALSEDLHTTVIANPEGSSTDELQTLKVGDTIYAVNKPTFETIKAFKITIANGGQYNTNKPIIEFYDDGGQKANITTSDYAVECDKTYAGNASMTEVCSIQTPETPGTFTYTFVNDFNTLKYHIMKLTRGGTFLNDIAKNIKIELSVDGTNFISIYDETSITWSDAVTSHLIDLATGEEASTLLPIVTSADNGNLLGVVNGVWDKGFKIVDTITDARLKAFIMKNNEIQTVSQEIQFYSNTAVTLDQDGFYHAIGYFAYMTNGIGVYTKLKHTDDVSILHADISTILRFTIGNITLDGVQTSLSKYCLIGLNAYPSVTLSSLFNALWYEVLIDRKNNKVYSIGFDSQITEVSGNDYDYEIKFKLHALT